MMVQKIVAASKIDSEHLLGTFLDESHFDVLIEEDTDCYIQNNCDFTMKADCKIECKNCNLAANEDRAAFVFRKGYFTLEEQTGALSGLGDAAVISENRGLAAGTKEGYENTGLEGTRQFVSNYQKEMMDAIHADKVSKLFENEEDVITTIRNKYPTKESRDKCEGSAMNISWVLNRIRGVFVFDDWVDSIIPLCKEDRVNEVERVSQFMSQSHYGNKVHSGVAGFYDRYPRIPYGRATAYNASQPEKFKLALPYMQKLSKAFSEMMPQRWNAQNAACKKLDPEFVIPDTVFTTITVNKTFRTAAHRDAGDLSTGFSNLGVVTTPDCNFKGGYLVFPEYRVAINIRPGDLLLINNHEIIHGNTEIIIDNPEKDARYSIVCYFREGMLDLGEKKYEDYRYNFVKERRQNEDHPLYSYGWNGISPKMWGDTIEKNDYENAKEWYNYLKNKEDGERYIDLYHPWLSSYFEGGFNI